MGVELLEIGVKVRKGLVCTIRGCFRSAWNHPFLVGILCFLIFLYRLSPFVFQLLVSASPILVCTAVLLGTILSFGQPNIPEIEVEEEETAVEVTSASSKTEVLGETGFVEKNESYYVERFSETSRDEGKIGREDSDDTTPLIEERSLETEVNDGEGRRELGDLVYEQKADWIEERLNNGEILENHFASDVKENDADAAGSDGEKSEADSFGSEKVNVDSLDSPPRSPWGRVEEREDEVEEDDALVSRLRSPWGRVEEREDEVEEDDALVSCPRSPWGRVEPVEEREDEGEEDDASDSGSSRAESSSPDASMADILPMLDELHPLLDDEAAQIVHGARDDFDAASGKSGRSGTSGHESDESENQEDLEAADDDNEDEEGNKEEERKSAIAWTEEDQKNLMDLGSSEIERNQRLENLILRRRARKIFADKNLIDLDSADLPFDIAPISTRRPNNPFDHSHDYYDNHPGLPPIPGSAPSVLLQRRNPFDIPYDSSEEKPDLMGDGFKEEFATSQPVFRRHESFNVGPSNFAPKRKDLKMRPFFVPEGSVSEESSSSMFQRQLSEVSESKLSSVPDTESISSLTSVEDLEDRNLLEEDNLPEVEVIAQMKDEGPSGDSELIYQIDSEENVPQEPEMISVIESVADHVGHGSQSSEDEEDSFELGHVENRDVEVIELESQLEDVADHSNYEAVERSDSSSSSLSEVSERVFTLTDVAEEPHISNETFVESNLLVNDVLHWGPVYDTSPRVLSTNVSSSSISCDVHPERESEVSGLAIGTDIPSNVEMLSVDESRPFDVDIHTEFSAVEERSIGEGSSVAADIASHAILLDSPDKASVEEHLMEQRRWDEVPVSSTIIKSSEDQNVEPSVEDIYSLLSGHSPVEVNEPPFEGQLRADHSVGVEETALHNEVQASSTSIESFVDDHVTQNLSMPEVQELDHYISSNANSPSSPEFVAIPPNAFDATTSHVDEHIIVEEVDEIKEIDDMLLSELDSVGDFSIQQSGSNSSTFDKHTASFGEADLSSLHETNSIRYFDVHSVEMNQIEDALHSKYSTEHVDTYEEDVEHISELQTFETSRAENIGPSRMEFSENEVQHGYGLANHNYEDTFSTVSQLEVGHVEDADAVPLEKDELTSVVTEIVGGGQVENDAMPELEASTIEDIDLAFKQISSKEIEKSVVLEPPQADFHDGEATVSALPESEVKSIEDVEADIEIPSGIISLEANKIEDIDLAFTQISCKEIEKPVVLDPPQAEFHNAIPASEVQSGEDVDAVSEKTELEFVGTEIMSSQGQADTETVSGMPEFAANTIRDIDLANEIERPVVSESPQAELEDIVPGMAESEIQSTEHVDVFLEEISSKEIEKTEVLEPHNHEDSLSGILDQSTEHIENTVEGGEVSSQAQFDTNTTSGITELEARTIEDTDLAFEQISSKEIEKPAVLDTPESELAVGTQNSEDHRDSTVTMSIREVGSIKDATLDHVIESGETQGASSKLHAAESLPSEDTILPPKLNQDDGSVEVEGEKLHPSEKESSAKEAEKAEHQVKGKVSKSTSSSSSSSSESSSSDSDKE